MSSISRLLDPRSIAVVGASPRGGRGGRALENLRAAEFKGDVFAINPRYEEVLGFPCYPSLATLPRPVDCLLVAIGADSALETLEAAHELGIEAAVVLAGGFGEGGLHQERADRLRRLGQRGMSICGPNCYGVLSLTDNNRITAYSGRLPKPLLSGNVSLVSQSGGLANYAFAPLMSDRQVGFRYIVSCGNQIATTVEDYIEAFIEDAQTKLIAAIVESIKNPGKLARVARIALERGKRVIFHHVGRSAAGQTLTRSHTGALVGNAEAFAAFVRRCGIVCIDDYDEFVEAIELFSVAPIRRKVSRGAMVVSGSGGGAAVTADAATAAGLELPTFSKSTQTRLKKVLPDFGSVLNPLDGTGSMSDDPVVFERVLDAILNENSEAPIAVPVNATEVASAREHRYAEIVAQAAAKSSRVLTAYQYSPLGGPLNAKIVGGLHAAQVPLLLGNAMAMRVLRYLSIAQDRRDDALSRRPDGTWTAPAPSVEMSGAHWDFTSAREALVRSGVPIVEARLAPNEEAAVAAAQAFDCDVALKAEAAGLAHKSDVGCVRLNCRDEKDVRAAYWLISNNARLAGFAKIDGVLIQPMVSGVAEVYAGIMNDPTFGALICLGLGGIFVEIFKDIVIEAAPLAQADARAMVHRLKGASLLFGARGRPAADVDGLVEFLVRLGSFAADNVGSFRSLDLNPVIVKEKGLGVVAVDIAVETWA